MHCGGPTLIDLPSGATIERPLDRLLDFFGAEYPYYDAIRSHSPDSIEPMDLLVTAAVNARLGPAATIRRIHRDMAAACEPVLVEIPEAAELEDFDVGVVAELVHAAVGCDGVAFAVATKVLHR